MENIMKHYNKAKAMWRGYARMDWDEFEIRVKCMYAYARHQNLLQNDDIIIKNIIKMYNLL
jgi:hypothetical protein